MLCATILRHVAQTTDVFAERRKMDPNRSCKRVQYLAKTYALCNHFTACSPNYRRFRRKAKNGPKSFMQTSPIFSKNVCFVQPFYGMWTKPDFLAEWRKLDWNLSMRMSPIFGQNRCFVQPFYGMWPKLQTLSHKGEKWTSIDLFERVQYLAKRYTLWNHFTACGPNLRLFRRTWRKLD